MDFKVKLVKKVMPVTEGNFTVGKVYDVKNNTIIADDGFEYNAWSLRISGNADFAALKRWFSQWFVFELVDEYKYKIGDHVVIKESNIESLEKFAGRTGVICGIEGKSHPYCIYVDDDHQHIWCEVAGYVEEKTEEKKVFTKKDLKNGDIVVLRNDWVGIVILEHDVLVTKTGWLNFREYDDDLTENKFFDRDWDIVKVIRPTKQFHCQFVCANNEDWGDVLFDRDRDTMRELTVKEIEKEFGVKVKLPED